MIAHAATYSWSLDAGPFVLAAIALALFVQAFARLRARGRADLAPWSRLVLWTLGGGVSLLALVSPLDGIAEEHLLSAHMLQHMLIMDLGPALMVVAIRGPLTFFLLPAPILRRVAAIQPLRSFLHWVTGPWVVLALYTAAVVAWHLPRAYDAALGNAPLHALEHASFALVGVLAWLVLVDPAGTRRLTGAGRILFGVGILAFAHPVTDALLFSGSPVYAPYTRGFWGISPLVDQRLAAVIMFVEQLATVGTCIALLLRPYLARRRQAAAVLAAQR